METIAHSPTFSTRPQLYVTSSLIAINLLVFLLMVLDGAGFFDSNVAVHILWGSNFTPLTLSGDSWRLLSHQFIHFGILHISMNMYALWSVGVYLEPVLGRIKFLAVYLCTGVIAGLLSLWWHQPILNGAGASGAIFGMYGVFLAFLSTTRVPEDLRKSLLQSTLIFISYNLFEGFTSSNTDNAAHLGGLVSGLVIGYAYCLPDLLQVSPLVKKMHQWVVPACVLATAVTAFLYLQYNYASQEGRTSLYFQLNEARYPDYKKFNEKLNDFEQLDESADAVNAAQSGTEFRTLTHTVAYPAWEKAENLLKEMEQLRISDTAKERIQLWKKYLKLRKTQFRLIYKYNYLAEITLGPIIDKNDLEIAALMEKIKKLEEG